MAESLVDCGAHGCRGGGGGGGGRQQQQRVGVGRVARSLALEVAARRLTRGVRLGSGVEGRWVSWMAGSRAREGLL